MYRKLTLLFGISLFLVACEHFEPKEPASNEVLEGPIEGLSIEENKRFLDGDIAFGQVFTAATGLGPIYNQFSCATCHIGDGKGSFETSFLRFGQTAPGENPSVMQGGPQFQDRSIPGFNPEQVDLSNSARFIAPAVTGLGLLEAVSDATILEYADSLDLNNDGISGVPNWKTLASYLSAPSDAVTYKGKHLHRFGRKAGAFNLLHQTANAYNQDMGIRSSFEAFDTYYKQNMEPEVADKDVLDVVFYLQTLKAPEPRNEQEPDFIAGKQLFNQLNCNSCHRESMTTGDHFISALSQKTIYPYTDMLLHDMGTNENYTEGAALTTEWRTPALWGLGLSEDAQGGHVNLMHGGAASSIEMAIEFHAGEGAQSRDAFIALSNEEQEKLIYFLKSL